MKRLHFIATLYKIAKSYDDSTKKQYGTANDKIINYTKKYCTQTTTLLDLGCGTGLLTLALADCLKQIEALDSSEEMIKIAKQKSINLGLQNIHWNIGSIDDFEINKNQYDIITAFNLLLYLKNPSILIQKIYDYLPQGGYFISVTDCIGKKFDLVKSLELIASKIGLLPFMHNYKMEELTYMMELAGFYIEYYENVHTTSPNFFIVAKKL